MRATILATSLVYLLIVGCGGPISEMHGESNSSATFSQIHVSTPDTATVGVPFNIEIRLTDASGQTVSQDAHVHVSANKQGISFSEYSDVVVKSGMRSIEVESRTWSGEGLQISVRSLRGDGSMLMGMSKRLVVVPNE